MRDFLDQLDRRLAAAAQKPEPGTAPRTARRRRPAALAGLTTVLAVGAASFTMTGTSVAELPILGTPTTDATSLRGKVPAADEARVDFSKAHAFGTPGGPGYALVNDDTDTVCLVAPDSASPGDYGSVCKRPIAQIEREGMALQIARDASSTAGATATTVVLLPEHATGVRLRSEGRTSTPAIESGVAAFELRGDGTLHWTQDGQRRQRQFLGPFRTDYVTVPCPDGRTARAELPPPALSGRAVGAFLRKAQEKACAA